MLNELFWNLKSLYEYISCDPILLQLWQIVMSMFVIALTFFFVRIFRSFFDRFILNSTRIIHNNPTSYQFAKHIVIAFIYLIGFSIAIYSIPSLRTLSTSLLAGAGIVAVAFGFASQAAFSNIISGLFIVIFRPFSVNERLIIDGNFGIVEDITLRHTVIRNNENKRIIIPNAIISEKVIINADLADEMICKHVEIGIGYDANIDKAMAVMEDVIKQHPYYLDNRTEKEKEDGLASVKIKVVRLGEYAVQLRAWVWANDTNKALDMTFDLNKMLKERFDIENIEIPFPYRTVIFKNTPKHLDI
ncbi:MAG: mechanosensitive ion channel family protein [Chitinophagales bacterium]